MLITRDSYIGKLVKDYVANNFGKDFYILRIWQPPSFLRARKSGNSHSLSNIKVTITDQGPSESTTIKVRIKDLK